MGERRRNSVKDGVEFPVYKAVWSYGCASFNDCGIYARYDYKYYYAAKKRAYKRCINHSRKNGSVCDNFLHYCKGSIYSAPDSRDAACGGSYGGGTIYGGNPS